MSKAKRKEPRALSTVGSKICMSNTRFQKDAAIGNLIRVCLQEALLVALTELAKTHDNEAGDWIDRIEADALECAKGASVSGPNADIDAAALKEAQILIREVFSDFRSTLEQE
jgi:hypothetical protein